MKRSLKIWLVAFAAVLVLFVTSVEVMHTHTERHVSGQHSKKSSDTCLICNAAHSPSVVTQVLSCPAPVLVEETVFSFHADPRSRLTALRLYVRPPPSTI